jgi:Ca2+-transporting ATPase
MQPARQELRMRRARDTADPRARRGVGQAPESGERAILSSPRAPAAAIADLPMSGAAPDLLIDLPVHTPAPSRAVAPRPPSQRIARDRPSPPPAAGLSAAEAASRLAAVGPNEIVRAAAAGPWRLIARQFTGAMVWLLLGASVVSVAVGEVIDAVAIGAILLLNGVVGFLQEYRAERAVLALRSLTAPHARVVRDGGSIVIAAREVVPGDLLVLEPGDVVAADARLVAAHSLTAQEAALTGESLPVDKRAEPIAGEVPLAERHDTVFLGTAIATGTGRAAVVATGMQTELGKIAHLLGTAAEPATPLEQRLARVGRNLLRACAAIIVVVAGVAVARGTPWLEVVLTSVSLAVAAVPEGLAAIITIALAVGLQRMAARNVLVRRLQAVETLGCATVICTDKTGTLTTGVMAVRELWGPSHHALLDAAAACCEAELTAGDPTEIALLEAAYQRGILRADIERERSRLSVVPFDSDRKWMAIERADGVTYVKGAIEAVLPRCVDGTAGAAEANAEMAARGLRVLAVAVGHGPGVDRLGLVGLVGLADPPRTEAVAAIAEARAAGIRTIMITGDHATTAHAIARELGLLQPGDDPDAVVRARATAADKLAIVRDLAARGEVVAMTGDGVNDAPALREAHVGIAMGRTGTEVTREASDMILTDDNYASIVAAVREGRGTYENIQKSLVWMLGGNAAELAVMLGASLAALPLPLLPLQLLWINLITDGLPALGLVMDPAPKDALARPPRRVDEPILGRAQWRSIALVGLLEAALALALFLVAVRHGDVPAARTMALSTIVFCQMFRVFAARSTTRIYWEVGAFTNVKLVAIVAGTILLQLAVTYAPGVHELLGLVPLSWQQLGVTLALGLVPVTVLEIAKLIRRAVRHRAT